ncbi:hypothetical protein [Deinococcus sp.]
MGGQRPSAEVLTHFQVHLLRPLGGRLNLHWQVRAGGDLLVLRR